VPHKNSTESHYFPQAQSANYFNSDHSEFVSRDKHLNSRKIHHYADQSANSPIFRPRNNNPRYPEKNKSRLFSAFYAALERGRTMPMVSILEREARRKWLAHNFILPAWLASQLPSGAAAELAVLCRRAADSGGTVEISNIELMDLTGMHVRNVQRNMRVLEERTLVTVERRKQHGARNLVNVYTIASSQLKAWIEECRRALLIGWRKCHGIAKEIESALKPAPKPAPKTLEETEIALRQAEPSALNAALLNLLSKVRTNRRLE
jgi:hypothetical protein